MKILAMLRLLVVVVSVLVTSLPCSTSQDGITTYVAQIQVFIDQDAVKNWKKAAGNENEEDMKTEIKSLFVEAREMFKSLKDYVSFTIDFEILDIVIMTDTLIKKNTDYKGAIDTMKSWVAKQNVKSYDIAYMFIGNKFSGNVKAAAATNMVCTARGVGMMTHTRTYDDAVSLAHELGHILGSPHDDGTYGDNCYKENGKIMNPKITSDPKATNFEFSQCSAASFRSKIEKLENENNNCLKDGKNIVTAPRFGKLLTLDQLCQRKHGKFAVSHNQENLRRKDMCVALRCLQKYYESSRYLTALTRGAPGMTCGYQKECVQGKCVHNAKSSSPFASESCPLGEQKMFGLYPDWYDYECFKIISGYCDDYRTTCCYSCSSNLAIFSMTADDVCKKLVDSNSAREHNTPNKELCSKIKCISGNEITTHITPDGLTCGQNKRCYKGTCKDNR